MSEAFILKYRPQKIAELDLGEVREGLLKVVKSGKIPHALLFTGPRGTGKTSAARIIAKVANCTSQKKGIWEPCNRCRSCKMIIEGTALDLIEIDAASTRGIDDIRNLREKVKLAPTQLKNKIYIIDEVHMLTTEAFNALLKTLEEPPSNTIFILCTTAPEKLPETIISRCTRFNFKKAKEKDVVGSLKRVIKGEKFKVEKGVLEEVAKSADGSFRDGQKILDQLASGKKKVTLKEAKKLLGRIESLSPRKLLSLLAEKELKKSLLEIERIVNTGGELTNYTRELLESLRQGLLVKAGLTEVEEPQEIAKLKVNQVKVLLALFSKAALEIKNNPIPQLPLELAVVEWCSQEDYQPKDPTRLPASDRQGFSSVNPATFSSQKGKANLKEIEKRWQELLSSIRPLNHSVEALLRASRPIAINGEVLTLEVFYRFHKDRLEEDKCRNIFEEAASQLFSQPIKLKCILGEKKNNEASATSSMPASKKVSPPSSAGDLKETASSDIIRVAEEIFGNDVN